MAPPGSEIYASGDEKYNVTGYASDGKEQKGKWEVEVSWDVLFSILGPKLESGLTRDDAISAMAVFYPWSAVGQAHPEHSVRYVYANIGDQIIYQFAALGLIAKRPDRSWQITPYGEKRLLEIFAIKSGAKKAKKR
jgi:hypothetical protein